MVRNAFGYEGELLGRDSDELWEIFALVWHFPVLKYGFAYCLHYFLGCSDSQGGVFIGGAGEAVDLVT